MKNLPSTPEVVVKAPVHQSYSAVLQAIRTPSDDISQRVLNNFRKTMKCRLRTAY